MKLATVRTPDGTSAARVGGETVTLINEYPDLGELLRSANWRHTAMTAAGPEMLRSEVEFAQPIAEPSKTICVGLNYTEHIQEMGRDLPEHPTLFAKFTETLTGPFSDIMCPSDDPNMDWEGELVVVIGERVRRISEAGAADAIAGYSIANDISMRSWQRRTTQWLQGKLWEASTPVGPVMTTADEFDAGTARAVTTVNDQVMQDHPISDLLFTPAFLVSYISQAITLQPGDLILTGTPGGVGQARDPQVFLHPGDSVSVSIDGIGQIRSQIVAPD